MLKKLPLPAAGVALGAAALGNLLESYSAGMRLFCGGVALLLLLLVVLKIAVYPAQFRSDMQNPIIASVFGTFSMAIMLLAGYAKPFIGSPAAWIWYVGIAIHIVLILYFTATFIRKLVLGKVFASYFIVYVGIVVASVTAPAFDALAVGQAAFWFGFVMLLALLVLVTWRYVKVREVPPPAQPLFCIYTAPASLCLAGYMQSFPEKSWAFAVGIALLSLALYIVVLVKLPRYLKMPFFPSYAAFTFPFVISAIGMKMIMAFAAASGHTIPGISILVLIETVIACVLVVYTVIRYAVFVFSKEKNQTVRS